MANVPVIRDPANSLRRACYNSTGLPLKSISLLVKPANMTDGTSTSGYIDFPTGALPASCILMGWKAVVASAAEAWDDDTTATLQVGVSGGVGNYSSVTSGSIAAAGTIGSVCPTTGTLWIAAAATPRVTITGGSDFTAFVTAAAPRVTVTLYYLPMP